MGKTSSGLGRNTASSSSNNPAISVATTPTPKRRSGFRAETNNTRAERRPSALNPANRITTDREKARVERMKAQYNKLSDRNKPLAKANRDRNSTAKDRSNARRALIVNQRKMRAIEKQLAALLFN